MKHMASRTERGAEMIRKVVQRIEKDGLRGFLNRALYEVDWRYREWRLGIDTAGIIDRKALSDNPETVEYEAIDYRCLEHALSRTPIRAGLDSFLDYGCGKGRGVIVAATRGFRRVIGVEHSKALCDSAIENVRRASSKLQCKDISIVHSDARAYDVPHDITVIMLFNPFHGQLLRDVLENVHRSLLQAPRTLTIIYMRPNAHEDALAGCDWLTKLADLPTGQWTWVRFALYQSIAVTSAGRGV